MSKRILITGGCGFIGAHFVRLVISSHPDWRVVNLDKLTYAGGLESLKGIEKGGHYSFVQGDIADAALVKALFREEMPWAVVNFAAETHVDRSILDASPFLQSNVVGVGTLLEAAREVGVERFVQISTDEVYGDREGRPPADESALLQPGSPYAASKAAADLLCLAYRRTYDIPVVLVRSSNNYGPFQFPEKLIPFMLQRALRGEPLPVYGDGLQRRDWLHVTDNCEAILRVLVEGRAGSIYNVGSGETRSNLEVVQSLCRLAAEMKGLDYPKLAELVRSVADRPGHDRLYAMDTLRIRSELGWSPRTQFEHGLRSTVRWHVEHQEWADRRLAVEYRW